MNDCQNPTLMTHFQMGTPNAVTDTIFYRVQSPTNPEAWQQPSDNFKWSVCVSFQDSFRHFLQQWGGVRLVRARRRA